MLKDGIEKKQINPENNWKKKASKRFRTKFFLKKTNKIKQLGMKLKIKYN